MEENFQTQCKVKPNGLSSYNMHKIFTVSHKFNLTNLIWLRC